VFQSLVSHPNVTLKQIAGSFTVTGNAGFNSSTKIEILCNQKFLIRII